VPKSEKRTKAPSARTRATSAPRQRSGEGNEFEPLETTGARGLVLVALVMTMAMPASGAPTRVSHPRPLSRFTRAGGVAKPASVGRGPRQTGITDYDVRRDFASAEQEMCNRLDNVHHFELRNGTLYTFTVVARNKVGAGSSSRPSNRVRTTIVTPTKGAKTSWWKPGPGVLPWQWEIDHALNLGDATDMARTTHCQRPARARAEGLRTSTAF